MSIKDSGNDSPHPVTDHTHHVAEPLAGKLPSIYLSHLSCIWNRASSALRLVALRLSIKGVGWMLVGATHASRVRPSAGLHVGCIRHAGVLAGVHVVLGEEGRVGANLVPLEG